jgi:raffinose/stachyose/melibiose transport system permease protein
VADATDASGDTRRRDTRTRIQEVALDLFTQRGAETTSLREIAGRLGISKAALYHHFPSKTNLIVSILQPMVDDVDAFLDDPRVAELPPRAFFEAYLDMLLPHRPAFQVLTTDASLLNQLEDFPATFTRWIERLELLLVGPDATTEQRVRALVAASGLARSLVIPGVGPAPPRRAAVAAPPRPRGPGPRGAPPPPAPRPPAGTARRGRGSRRDWRKAAEILFFVTPALALFALFVIVPVLTAVQMSVYRWRGFGPLEDFVGFRNYASVLTNDVFQGAVAHTMTIVVGSIVLQLPLGLAIALLLNRKMKGQGLLRTIVFVPFVLSEVIAGVIWFQLLQPRYGVIDTLLEAVGLPVPAQGWLGDRNVALWTILVVLTWKYLGLPILLFLAGLQSIPDELYEAAQLDGASWWQTQRKITIPLLGPTMRTWAFLSMIGSLQLFDMVWVLTRGGPANSTTTMVTFLVNEGTERGNYGIAGAASVILFVIALTMAVLYQRLVLRRDTKEAGR